MTPSDSCKVIEQHLENPGAEMGLPEYRSASSLAPSRSKGSDRRRACRNPVVLPEASLGWWQDSTFMSTAGRIVDLSLYGCLVESWRFPPERERQPVWVCPLDVSPRDWAEGVVISARKPLLRKCQLRIRFVAPFPYESFKTLVYGPGHLLEVARDETPEHERDEFWK
jgi:hypothetical protein